MEYLYRDVLMGYILQLIEEDPTVQMKELYKEIESKRFDAKNIHREQEDLIVEIEKAREAIATFEIFMKNMKVKK